MNTIFALLFCLTCVQDFDDGPDLDGQDIVEHPDGYLVSEEGMQKMWAHIERLESTNEVLEGHIKAQDATIDYLEYEVTKLERREGIYRTITAGALGTTAVVLIIFAID